MSVSSSSKAFVKFDLSNNFFKFDNKIKNNYSKKILNNLGKNKFFKKYTTEFADKGIVF